MITGVAISPLLGVSAVGCYQYCKAETDEQRAKLPWFASPVFWVPAFLVLALCFLKDTAGVALPTAAKKPLDAIDRKSTRLNSSHLGISYAVFCLKKRKPNARRPPLPRR